jgi:hypothetical protein
MVQKTALLCDIIDWSINTERIVIGGEVTVGDRFPTGQTMTTIDEALEENDVVNTPAGILNVDCTNKFQLKSCYVEKLFLSALSLSEEIVFSNAASFIKNLNNDEKIENDYKKASIGFMMNDISTTELNIESSTKPYQ